MTDSAQWQAEREQLMQQIVSLRNYIARLEKYGLALEAQSLSRPERELPYLKGGLDGF